MKASHAPELVVNFAPTGMVPMKAHSPHVPTSVAEIVEGVHEAADVGITVAHLHARYGDGAPAWEADCYAPIVEGIRRHCPDLVVCVSTSGRRVADFERRSSVLSLRPDMASLTLGSMNFASEASINAPEMIVRLAAAMDAHGVVPELECFDQGMVNYARYLIGKRVLHPPFYFNLLLGNVATAQADLAQIVALLGALPGGACWALGGIGGEQLRANAIAIIEGGGVRVGLEDNLWVDRERRLLASNLDLLRRVHGLAAIFERRVMAPTAFRALGFGNRLVAAEAS